MVGRVALATQALFLILLLITPHLVLAHGGKQGRGSGGKKPAKPHKIITKKAAPHGKKPTAPRVKPHTKPVPKVPHKPVVAPHKPAVVPRRPAVKHQKPATPYRPIVHPATKPPVAPVGSNAGKGNGAGITYKGGPLMSGEINLSILFYGQWQSRHKDFIRSFLNSFGIPGSASWKWKRIVEGYSKKGIAFKVGTQQSDDNASLGKVLTKDFIKKLVPSSAKPNTVFVILAHKDIGTQDLCRGKCYDHGSFDGKLPYLIVGNPETMCPGSCGLPFAKANYGPSGPVVQPPNGDRGVDATIINFAAGLASVLTNPFPGGFSKPGPKSWPIEAGNACQNNFGKLTIESTGVGYNAVGERNIKFVLPAVWDPVSNSCWAPM